MTDIFFILRRSLNSGACLVGGALRDALMGRFSPDIDIALPMSASTKKACCAGVHLKARRLAKALGGKSFPLDKKNSVYRVITRDDFPVQIDLSVFQGESLVQDLNRRDFTANAMAYPLAAGFRIQNSECGIRITGINASSIIDPHGGIKDIKRRVIRITSGKTFKDDPVRMVKVFRCAAELGWDIHPATLATMRRDLLRRNACLAGKTAPERIHDELWRLLEADTSSLQFAKMDRVGLLTKIFPELDGQRLCARVYYGKGGCLKHSLTTVDRMEYLLGSIGRIFPHLRAKLAPFAAQKGILKLAALLHDVAKPAKARRIKGRLRFFGHEKHGAKMAEHLLKKLRFSRAHIRLVSKLIAHHLRPGNLAANVCISNKAVYRFFRELGPDGILLLLLCWADHTSYLPLPKVRSIEKRICEPPLPIPQGGFPAEGTGKTLRYLQVINRMLCLYLAETSKVVPERLVNGNDVMRICKLPSGPEIGRILEQVRMAQMDEKIATRKDAIEFIRQVIVL